MSLLRIDMTNHDCRRVIFFFFQAEDGIRDWRDWSSDVCSSDLAPHTLLVQGMAHQRLDRDGDGLVRPVRDYHPDPLLAGSAVGVTLYPSLILIEPRALGWAQIQPGLHGLGHLEEIKIGRASCRERV